MIKLRISTLVKVITVAYYEGSDPISHMDYNIKCECFSEGEPEQAQKDLIKDCCDFIGVDTLEVQISMDEPERFDISILECAEGSQASKLEIQRWKQGKEDLFYCDYSFYVEHVQDFKLIR